MLIGHTLKNRYHIYDRLGSGGAAAVFLGRDAESGQMVVIKVMHAHLINDQFMARFEREIDLLSKIDSPYIIRLYDWALRQFEPDIGETLSYLVTEFVEGHTLADIIDTRGPLNEADALAIARHVALALDTIHSRGIIHRDIKSQNIMITPDSRAKLIDFGIAKAPDHATLTASSQFAGTLYYAAPEQILGTHSVDQRADIYSLGIVLYEMLTATLPVKAREIGTVASRIISGDLDPISGVSQPVEALVNRMIAYKAANRTASAAEVARAIEDIIGQQAAQLEDLPAATIAMPSGQSAPGRGASGDAPRCMLVTDNGVEILVRVPETVIGRSHPRDSSAPDIDLAALELDNALTASRRHCRIFYQDGQYFIEDLGSMNGTSLNDVPLQAGTSYPLHEDDRIAVARVHLTFCRMRGSMP